MLGSKPNPNPNPKPSPKPNPKPTPTQLASCHGRFVPRVAAPCMTPHHVRSLAHVASVALLQARCLGFG